MLGFDRWGLATRLTALSVLAVFVGTSVGGWMLREYLHASIERSFEAQLKDRLDRLLLQFEGGGVQATRSDRAGQGDFGRIFSGWYWVVTQDGTEHQSRSSWDSPLDLRRATDLHGNARLWTLTDATGRPLLGLRHSVVVDGVPSEVHVFGPMEQTLAAWAHIDRVLLTVQALMLLCLALLVAMAVRWGLAPLRRMQARMQQVHQGRLPAVGQGFSADLDPLAAVLDQVLSRNEQVVARAQNQAADLSHALKKPLALLTLEARKATLPGPWVLAQAQALSHTIDRHLARLGSGAGTQEPVPVCAVLQRILGLMQQLHADRGLHWATHGCPPSGSGPLWRGNAADLEEMLGNLLDNAGKWAGAQVQVGVQWTQAQNSPSPAVCLLIDDDGPGLSEGQLAQAAQRGRRFDEEVPGHGLGLAIVRDLAETYQGRLELRSSPLGGLRCELHLPLI